MSDKKAVRLRIVGPLGERVTAQMVVFESENYCKYVDVVVGNNGFRVELCLIGEDLINEFF